MLKEPLCKLRGEHDGTTAWHILADLKILIERSHTQDRCLDQGSHMKNCWDQGCREMNTCTQSKWLQAQTDTSALPTTQGLSTPCPNLSSKTALSGRQES